MQNRLIRLLLMGLMTLAACAVWADEVRVEQLLQAFDRQPSVAVGNAFLSELRRLEFFDEPIQLAEKDGRDTLCQQVWYWAAEWLYDQARYQQAADYARRALPLLHIPSEQADCQSLLSIIHVRLGDYRQAADYAKRVYELDRLSGDPDRESSSLNTLAGIYLYAGQPREAEQYILRAIPLAEQAGNTARLAVIEGKASEICHALGNDSEALRHAEAAYRLDRDAARTDKATLRLAQKASALIGLERYGEAEQVLADIIPQLRQQGERQSLGIACNKMGQALASQKRQEEAEAYYREAAQIFAAAGDMANELQARRGLYESLWKRDPDAARRELDRFNALRDSIYNKVSAESLARYDAEFGNDWLRLENQSEREARRRAVVMGVIGVLLLVLLTAAVWVVMHRRHRRQQAINAQLTTDINTLREQYRDLQTHYDHALTTTRDQADEAGRRSDGDQEFVEKTTAIVDALINEGQVDASTVAERLGMSLFQLRQRLGDATGETPQAFIQTVRMRRARHLLDHHPELNITEIGQLCGYQDTPNFTRAFKKMFGITPSQYLEKQRNCAK